MIEPLVAVTVTTKLPVVPRFGALIVRVKLPDPPGVKATVGELRLVFGPPACIADVERVTVPMNPFKLTNDKSTVFDVPRARVIEPALDENEKLAGGATESAMFSE